LHDLRKKESNSNGTDFLNELKTEASSLGKRLLDVVINSERHSYVDFQNFSENQVRTKSTFFKLPKIDYSIFDSEKDTRNYITRFHYKLSNDFNTSLVVSTSGITQNAQESIQKFTYSKNQKFTEDLFVLYDLQSFLHFIKLLEVVSEKNITLKDSLNYAYHILYDYYFTIFKTHDHDFEKDNLIEYILQNDDFRILSDENPLSKGFVMLFTHSIDVPQLLEKIDNE